MFLPVCVCVCMSVCWYQQTYFMKQGHVFMKVSESQYVNIASASAADYLLKSTQYGCHRGANLVNTEMVTFRQLQTQMKLGVVVHIL